ncbi:hypothetical protein QCA50_014290 [Cerrena zonata]|uniref:chitinase n=1 Tax=Cerrena zonata TaxID=2478898 RepID=A0AAW0FUH4_9APHY
MFLSRGFSTLLSLTISLALLGGVAGFDASRKDNLAVYWGQDGAGSQQRLSFYCSDDTINVIPLAFLYIFRGTGGQPVVDLGPINADIKTCQSKGKLVTLSLGGGTGQVGFSSDSQAQTFADQVWDEFLGGSSSTRPFGDAVLDGVDLDIESGTPAHYAAFVNRIRSHASGASKKYFITAAPQCPFPDANIGDALNQASFDAVYVQFYNNFCGLNHPSDYNLATWDNWAKTQSANKNVKVYIGAPGSADAAGEGYVDAATLATFAKNAQNQFSSFGGVMLWDADSAFTNNRYDKAIKSALTANAIGPIPSSVASVKSQAHSTAHASKPSTAAAPQPSTVKDVTPTSTARVFKPVSTFTPPEDGPVKAPHEILHKEPRTARINSRFFRL